MKSRRQTAVVSGRPCCTTHLSATWSGLGSGLGLGVRVLGPPDRWMETRAAPSSD